MATDDCSVGPPPPPLPTPCAPRPAGFDAATAAFHSADVGDVLRRKRRDAAGNVCGVSRCVVLGADSAGRLVCAEDTVCDGAAGTAAAAAAAAALASVSVGEGEWRQVTPSGTRPSVHGWSPAHVAAVVCAPSAACGGGGGGGGPVCCGDADGDDDCDDDVDGGGWLPPPPPALDGAQEWASVLLSDNKEALLTLPPREKAESQKGLLKRSRKLRCFAPFGRSTDHRAVRAAAAAAGIDGSGSGGGGGGARHFFSEEIVVAAAPAGSAGGEGAGVGESDGVLRRGYVVARECPLSCVADPADPYLWADVPSANAQDPSLAYFVRGGGDGDGVDDDADGDAAAAAAATAAADLAAAKEGFFLSSMYRDAAAAAAVAAAAATAEASAGVAAAAASLVCVAASARVCRRGGGTGGGRAGAATQVPRLSKREKARRAAKGVAAAAATPAAGVPPRTALERVAWATDAEKERRHGAYEERVQAGHGVVFRHTERSVRGGVLCLTVAADSADLSVCPRCGGARLRHHRRQVVRCGCGGGEGREGGRGGVCRVAQEGFGAAAVLNPSYARTVAALQVSEVQRVFRDDPGLVHNPLFYTACLLRVCRRYGATVDGRYSSLPASGEALRLEVTARYHSAHPRYGVAAAASCAATAGLKVTVHVGVAEGQMLRAGSVPVCADPALHKRLVWGIAAVRMLRVWHAPLCHAFTHSNARRFSETFVASTWGIHCTNGFGVVCSCFSHTP